MKPLNNKALTTAGITEHFFHAGDALINYASGPPNGEAIVFIPGQSVTWEEYVLLMPLLAPRYQVYAVSLPGHGKSSWTPGRYTFAELGAVVAAFIRGVVGGPAIVGGNSSGGVLTMWLAANEPDLVRGLILEDPPIFRCEWPAIKETVVYDVFLGLSKMAVAGGGGFSRLVTETLMPMGSTLGQASRLPTPPKAMVGLLGRWLSIREILRPGAPIDVRFLPLEARLMMRSMSQFDGHFSRAFVEGTAGRDFDHATALPIVRQPTLFLHANWHVRPDGRLVGALTDDDVDRVRSLIGGPFDYVRLDAGHAIPIDSADREYQEILAFLDRHKL